MDDLFEPENSCVALHLRRLSRVVTRRYEDALRPLNLKSFQFSALVALSRRETIAQTNLAKAFGMDVSTLNRNLKPLVARGAIEIASNPKDGRVRLIKITSAGLKLLDQAMPLWEAAQAEALGRLEPEAWPDLRRGMNKLLDTD
ncbi:MAG: MarR family winged helix-turn-helix transcriptional regulator [Pseudomonadota bacterium]